MINKYEMTLSKFDVYPKETKPWIYFLGLSGEVGELCEKYKKIVRDGGDLERNHTMLMELGDVLWYLTRIASQCGFSMGEVIDKNLEKLNDRLARNVIHGNGDTR